MFLHSIISPLIIGKWSASVWVIEIDTMERFFIRRLFVSRTIPLTESEKARTAKPALLKCSAAYNYDRDHGYGIRVSPAKNDYFLGSADPLAVLSLWWTDKESERGTADYLSVWEDGWVRAIAEGEYLLGEFQLVLPVMRVIPALGCLWRVLGASMMSWRQAGHMKTEHMMHWSLPDDAAFNLHPQFWIMRAKLECFLCGPEQVEALEVLDYLPQPGSCKWVHDRSNHIVSSVESLGVLMSMGMLTCGESRAHSELAAGHAKAAAARHHSPQKVMHAQAALGRALDKSTHTESSAEAAALLDEAHRNAQKMRLQRYADMIQEDK